jgi:hypothetical protein
VKSQNAEPVNCATSDGALKMPAPITMPTMIAIASRSESVGCGTALARSINR